MCRRPPLPMLVAVLVFMCWSSCCPPYLVLARQRPKSRLALWIDERQVRTLIGWEMEIPIISEGEVTPYLNNPELSDHIIIPPEIDTVNLTWQAGPDRYTYLFDNFTSLDQHLLYQPLLGIPARGYIPRFPTVFQITIPCKGKERGVASLMLGLKIYDPWGRPLKGTPLQFRLKKQCVAFALCSPACQNNGTCISPSTCACPAGFQGQFCEKGTGSSLSDSRPAASVCGRTCQNGGHCLAEGFCWCADGFFGDACEYSHCNPPCQNGGTCTGPSQCLCSAEFSGSLCDIKDDTDRPRRSKAPDNSKVKVKPEKKKKRKRKRKSSLDIKVRKAEKRLLKITYRRSRKWDIPKDVRRTLRRLKRKAETEALNLQERRYLIKLLTRERRHLNSKDKTKVKRFKNLIRKVKRRQKKPRKRRLYVR